MLCPNCETQNDDNARLCVECGFPLSGSVSRGAGATSPAKVSTPRPNRPSRPTYQSSVAAADATTLIGYQGEPSQPRARQNGYASSTQDFVWDAPARGGNPAKGLFEPTGSFEAVSPSGMPLQTSQQSCQSDSQPSGSIQQPQIIQVDLQGRELRPDTTQQMHPIEPAQPVQSDDYYEDDYEFETPYFDTEFLSPATQDFSQTYEEPYGSPEESPYSQDDFDSFYQGQASTTADTIKFDDDRTTVQPSRSYSRNRTKTAKKGSKSSVTQRNYRIPQKKEGLSGKQRGLVIGGIVVVVAALVLVVGFAFGLWGGVPVPNVENMNQSDAVRILEDNGFKTRVVEVKSDEIEGRVISTEPRAGSFAEEGSEVIVNVAVARTIPDVVGMDLEKALVALEESGYTNVKTQIERGNGPENIVISSTPAADTRAKSTMEITLVITENYKVPDISGMTYDQAAAAIREAGLNASVVYIDTDEYPDGTLIGSDPEAGTRVDEGSTVGIKIARKRGVELNALATQLLSAGNTVNVAGVNYQVESLTSLNYQGDDVVAFTFQGKPYVEFFGETLFASSSQTVSGSIQYNSANEVVSIT